MSDNLDDLILTDPEPETPKSKGVLALLALVVLLIVVGAVLAKMIFSSPNDDANATQNEAIKAPVVAIDSSDDSNKKASEVNSSSIESDLTPLDAEDAQKNVETVSLDNKADKKADSGKSDKNSNDSADIDNNEPEDLSSNSNLNKENLAGSIVSTRVNPVTHKVETTVAKTKKQVKHIKHKNVVLKPNPTYTHKSNVKTSSYTSSYASSGNTYIQVGSFAKGPAASFIRKIRNAGFRYRIREVNGYRRVLVGPFTSAKAKKVLGRVKSRISPAAFITK